MRNLVAEWEARILRDKSRFDRLVPEAEERGSILREPASLEAVEAAERRLGAQLPSSYRAFLQISNGAYASSIGPEVVRRGLPQRHGWLPVEGISHAIDSDAATVQLWTERLPRRSDPANARHPDGVRPVLVTDYSPLRDAVSISRPLEVWRDVLVPRHGSTEWEFWAMAKEGAGAYRSFADLLRFQIERPEVRPLPELADNYAAEVEAGRYGSLITLAEVDGPRAGEIACKIIGDHTIPEMARRSGAWVLELLADPGYGPALQAAYMSAELPEYKGLLEAAITACRSSVDGA